MFQWIVVVGVGAISGYFGSEVFKERGLWFLGNIIIGIAGSCIGFLLFKQAENVVENVFVKNTCSAAAGAIVTVELLSLVSNKKYINLIAVIFKRYRNSR